VFVSCYDQLTVMYESTGNFIASKVGVGGHYWLGDEDSV
jgi:hypothetical protein